MRPAFAVGTSRPLAFAVALATCSAWGAAARASITGPAYQSEQVPGGQAARPGKQAEQVKERPREAEFMMFVSSCLDEVLWQDNSFSGAGSGRAEESTFETMRSKMIHCLEGQAPALHGPGAPEGNQP